MVLLRISTEAATREGHIERPFALQGRYTLIIGDHEYNDDPTGPLTLGFDYDPSLGDLILEIVTDNQELGSDGYLYEEDGSQTVTSAAYCWTGAYCGTFSGVYGTLDVTPLSTSTTDAPNPQLSLFLGPGWLVFVVSSVGA